MAQDEFGVRTRFVEVDTRGNDHVVDLTARVEGAVRDEGLQEGTALVFVRGSTAGVTTLEFEPGLVEDLPAVFERIAPRGARYAHHETWHDGNGHSHCRASVLGPDLVVPVHGGKLLLGTWQQVVLVDFDNRPRHRQVVVQLTGRFRR